MISIIVPVYNVEKYIIKCYESIKKQSVDNWEMIFINDGSSDNSFDLCVQLSQIDKRVIVHSQENQGVAAARNLGLAYATGRYITFLDADDFWSADVLGWLCDEIESDKDIDMFYAATMIRRYPNGKEIVSRYDINEGKTTPFEKLTSSLRSGGWSCVNGIFKRSLVTGSNIVLFKDGVKIGEDADWFFRASNNCATITLIPITYYVYNINRSGSAMTYKSLNSISSYLKLVIAWKENIDGYPNNVAQTLDRIFTQNFIDYYVYLFYYKAKDWETIYKEISRIDFYNICEKKIYIKYRILITMHLFKPYLKIINVVYKKKMQLRYIVRKNRNKKIIE